MSSGSGKGAMNLTTSQQQLVVGLQGGKRVIYNLFLVQLLIIYRWVCVRPVLMHVRRQSKSQTTEKSGTINVVTFAAANLLCTNQTWGRANEVSDFPREVSDNWGHAILSWAIPSNGQAPGRETPFSGDD